MPAKRTRPKALPGITYQMDTNLHCGKIFITITTDEAGRPLELFVRFGKAGYCGAAIFDGITKIVSYALRSGMDPQDAVKAFSGILCSFGRQTCLNAVAEALAEVIGPGKTGDSAEKRGESKDITQRAKSPGAATRVPQGNKPDTRVILTFPASLR